MTFFLSFKNVESCFLKRRIVFWGPKHPNFNFFLLPKFFLEFYSSHFRDLFFLLFFWFLKMLNHVQMSLSVFLSSFLSFSDGRNWRNFVFFFLSYFLTFFFFFLSFYMQLHATICFFQTWDSSVQHCLFSVYPCLHSVWLCLKNWKMLFGRTWAWAFSFLKQVDLLIDFKKEWKYHRSPL